MKKIIVVGGGTAGIVIAYNLCHDYKVTVIENSYMKNYPLFYKVPLFVGLMFNNLKYISVKDVVYAKNRKLPYFQSNIFGGASVINGCVHSVGSERMWDKFLDNFGFSFIDVQLSHKKIYSYSIKCKNKIKLTSVYRDNLDDLFLSSLNKMGVSIGDMIYSNAQKCGSIVINSTKWFRQSVLSLIESNNNFEVLLGRKVDKIIFDGMNNAIGVRVEDEDIYSDYVICSAGVLGTNMLLLKTRDYLIEMGNDVLCSHPIGVGVSDHPNLRVKVKLKGDYESLNDLSCSWSKKTYTTLKHIVGIDTLFRTPGATSAVYLDLDNDGIVDVKIQLVRFSESGRLGSSGAKKIFDKTPGMSLAITLINPKSTGVIIKDGREGYKVIPKYFSCTDDIDVMKKALDYCLELLEKTPFKDCVDEIVDLDKISGDMESYIKSNFYSGYHLIGGACNSTQSQNTVIDENFEVCKIKNLYVCDASIFNNHVSSNTHAPTVIIADIFSKNFMKLHNDGAV